MAYWDDILDQKLKVAQEALQKRYAPQRSALRSRLIESGVDPESAMGGTEIAGNLSEQMKEEERMQADVASEKVRLDQEEQARQDALKAQEDAKKAAKRSFWGNLAGTIAGTALSALVPGGWAAAKGIKGFAGRFLGGMGGTAGQAAGRGMGGGYNGGMALSESMSPEDFTRYLRQRRRGQNFGQQEVSPEEWDQLYQ